MYLMYRNATPVALEEPVKAQELNGHIIDVGKMGTMEPNHAATAGAVGKVWISPLRLYECGETRDQWQEKLKKGNNLNFNYFTEWGHI